MDDLELLLDLHLRNHRQGPGSDDDTRRAIRLSGLQDRTGLRVADIGCGTGAQTLVLASELDAHVVAVDFLAPFLRKLDDAAQEAGVGSRVETREESMEALSFDDESFDAIWSEGAIYNVGFEAGVRAWRRLLRPGGVLAVSEITWLTAERPAALTAHWDQEYPEVDRASAKLSVLEDAGFTPVGYFPLPPSSWLDGYYRPLQRGLDAFLARHGHSAAARAIVDAERREIALYEEHQAFVGYGFYVARKTPFG